MIVFWEFECFFNLIFVRIVFVGFKLFVKKFYMEFEDYGILNVCVDNGKFECELGNVF